MALYRAYDVAVLVTDVDRASHLLVVDLDRVWVRHDVRRTLRRKDEVLRLRGRGGTDDRQDIAMGASGVSAALDETLCLLCMVPQQRLFRLAQRLPVGLSIQATITTIRGYVVHRHNSMP